MLFIIIIFILFMLCKEEGQDSLNDDGLKLQSRAEMIVRDIESKLLIMSTIQNEMVKENVIEIKEDYENTNVLKLSNSYTQNEKYWEDINSLGINPNQEYNEVFIFISYLIFLV